MRSKFRGFKYIILKLLAATFLFILIGCEDDPLLEPSSTTGSGGNGSYGKLTVTDSTKVTRFFETINPETF